MPSRACGLYGLVRCADSLHWVCHDPGCKRLWHAFQWGSLSSRVREYRRDSPDFPKRVGAHVGAEFATIQCAKFRAVIRSEFGSILRAEFRAFFRSYWLNLSSRRMADHRSGCYLRPR